MIKPTNALIIFFWHTISHNFDMIIRRERMVKTNRSMSELWLCVKNAILTLVHLLVIFYELIITWLHILLNCNLCSRCTQNNSRKSW